MDTQQRHTRTIDKQILMEFYKAQLKDIYDMNNLDWRVALIFIPLMGAISFVFGIALEFNLKEIDYYTQGIKVVSLIIYLISLYGLWTIAKGQAHTRLKYKTMSWVEKDLRVAKDLKLHDYIYERERYQDGIWPVIVCRRIVLYIVYFFLGVLSFSIVIVPVDGWSLFEFGYPLVWAVAFGVTLIIVSIHWQDYKLHQCARAKSL